MATAGGRPGAAAAAPPAPAALAAPPADAHQGQYCLLLIQATNPSRPRQQHEGRRKAIARDHVISNAVKKLLIANDIVDKHILNLDCPAAAWTKHFQHLHEKVIALGLAKRGAVNDILDFLSESKRVIREYFLDASDGDDTLMFFRFVEMHRFQKPRWVNLANRNGSGSDFNRACFTRCSTWTAQRVCAGMREVVADWQARHQTGHVEMPTCLTLKMPWSHALLCACGVWTDYAFPLACGRRSAALGLHLVPQLLGAPARTLLDRIDGDPFSSEAADLTPDILREVVDTMRRQLLSDNPEHRDEVIQSMRRLQCTADDMARANHRLTSLAFKMDFLVTCLLHVDLLKSHDHFQRSLESALTIAVPIPNLAAFLRNRLQEPAALPSKTTLLRHRLTLHMAYCRWMADCCATMLSSGGVVRYSTVDSSPQHSHEWVLSGSTTVPVSALVPCFRALLRLSQARRAGFIHPDQEKEAAALLSQHIVAEQEVPVTVGSGRAGVRSKVHALSHSMRLKAKSWRDVAELLNATVSWTGDLGVESGLAAWHGNLRTLHGDWITQHARPYWLDYDEDEGAQFDFDVEAAGPMGAGRGAAAEAAPADARLSVDMRGSIFAAGILHVVHNATEGLGETLQHFAEFTVRLTQVCRLLSLPWARKRFCETCLNEGPAAQFKYLFSNFTARVYTGRWGTIVHAIGALVPLQMPLRAAWSKAAFSFGSPGRPRDGGNAHNALLVDVIDEAIRSDFFGHIL